MMEAEFFGYEKGAFTGSHRAHKGFVERADGGTLFLDEVGDLPASMQARCCGTTRTLFFRFVDAPHTATFASSPPPTATCTPTCWPANFARPVLQLTAVIRIEIPPLRERPEDIRWLTDLILQQITHKAGTPIAMSELFLRDVIARTWRGGVRGRATAQSTPWSQATTASWVAPCVAEQPNLATSSVTTPPGACAVLHAVVEDASADISAKPWVTVMAVLAKPPMHWVFRARRYGKMKRLEISVSNFAAAPLASD